MVQCPCTVPVTEVHYTPKAGMVSQVVYMQFYTCCACFVVADGEYAEPSSGQIQRKGMGTHYSTNGMVYTGQWANDKMNGQGQSDDCTRAICTPVVCTL